MAISGLHLSVIGIGIYQLLRKLTGSYTIGGIGGIFFFFLYVLMIGVTVSVIRAGIMYLFTVCPGTDEYVLGAPLFKKAVLHFENGNSLTIDAGNNSAQNVYIQSLQVDGNEYTKNYLRHGDLLKGGTLKFEMGDKPNLQRGVRAEDYPYSFSKEKRR